MRRWAEAISQNLVASGVWLGGAALAAFLLANGGDQVTVRIWWLAVVLLIAVSTLFYLRLLSSGVKRLSSRVAALEATPAARTRTAASIPYQELLDEMAALIADLSRYGEFDHVSWEIGRMYNDLIAQASAASPRVALMSLPTAEPVAMAHGPDTTQHDARTLLSALKRARVPLGGGSSN